MVSTDLRLLELSPFDIRIAVIIDPEIRPEVIKEYFHKKPVEPFPVIPTSYLLLKGKEKSFLRQLKAVINHSKCHLLLSKNRELRKRVLDQLKKICDKLHSVLRLKPIPINALNIGEKKERNPNLNITEPIKATGNQRINNVLKDDLKNIMNQYSFPHLKRYLPNAVQMTEEMQQKGIDYFTHIGQLLELVERKFGSTITGNSINEATGFLIGSTSQIITLKHTKIQDGVRVTESYEETLKRLDEIRSTEPFHSHIKEINNCIDTIEKLYSNIVQLIEFEQLK